MKRRSPASDESSQIVDKMFKQNIHVVEVLALNGGHVDRPNQ